MIFMLTLTLAFTSMGAAKAEEAKPDKVTIIHTNDMHGRLNQGDKVKDANGKDTDVSIKGTRLSRLKSYVNEIKPNLVLDGGDSIQGLPISNINKGEYMVEAMLEVGFDAMTLGNHEFDFGYDRAQAIKKRLEGTSMLFMTSTVYKDDKLGFVPYEIIEKDGIKTAIIAFTTPETETKTHPKNIEGVTFKSPKEQADIFIPEVMDKYPDLDVLVLLGHLGLDGETKDDWRGDMLAKYVSEKDLEISILVVDGHSHTPVDGGEMFGKNVLYVQTGEYLNNIGHVELDLKDFSKSTAKLVKIETVTLKDGETDILDAENAANVDYEKIAGEVLVEDFPYFLNGSRDFNRTRETNLGNLIGDAMVAYGKGLAQKPDFAVMNGGGIRADLKPGKITKGDAISVIPFGNMYSSIEVSGKQVKEMFEFALRVPISKDKNGELIKDDLGNYVLTSNGGFLQVSSTVRLSYNPMNEENNRVQKIEVDRLNGWEEVTPEGKYIVATNDFLAQGGDGYKMLGGPRIEGESLDDVFALYLQNKEVDWSLYKEEYNPTRIIQLIEETEEELTPTPEVKPEVKPTPDSKPTNKPDKVLPNVGIESNVFTYGSLLIASGMTSLGFLRFKRKED